MYIAARVARVDAVWLCGCCQALALSHFLKEKGCYPGRVKDPSDIAQFFFQACAIEMNVQQLAVIAATLAGVGTCPLTLKSCFGPDVARILLSLLYSCGMTSHAGVWNFHVGIPGTCSSSGVLMVRSCLR